MDLSSSMPNTDISSTEVPYYPSQCCSVKSTGQAVYQPRAPDPSLQESKTIRAQGIGAAPKGLTVLYQGFELLTC